MSSAEFSGPSDEGQFQERKDLPNKKSPADGDGGAAEAPFGSFDKSKLVPQLPRDPDKPEAGRDKPVRPISSVNSDPSPFVSKGPAAGKQRAQGGSHDKAEEESGGSVQGSGAKTAREGATGLPVERADGLPTASTGDGNGSGRGRGDTDEKGGYSEPDPDAPDEINDAIDDWLRNLSTSAFAQEVLLGDKRKGREKKGTRDENVTRAEIVELPPDDLKALPAYIEEREARLREVTTITMPLDRDIIYHEPSEDDGWSKFLIRATETPDTETRDRLRTTMGRAVCEIQRIAWDMLIIPEDDNFVETGISQGTPSGGMISVSLIRDDQEEQTETATPLYSWKSDMDTGKSPKKLFVETTQVFDESGEPLAERTLVRLSYSIQPGGNVQLIDTATEYWKDGAIDYSSANALLTSYLDQAPTARISFDEAVNAFAVASVLTEAENVYSSMRAKQKGEDGGLDLDVPASVNATPSSAESAQLKETSDSPISERALAIKDAKEGVFTVVRELMEEQDTKSLSAEVAITGEAVIVMMELNAELEKLAATNKKSGSIEDDIVSISESTTSESVSKLLERLEKLPRVPLKIAAKAYLIDSAIFNSFDSQLKLLSLLEKEKQTRIQAANSGPENAKFVEPRLIGEIASECARLGINPFTWIESYALNEDDKWRLNAIYQHTLRLQDKREDKLEAHLYGLAKRDQTSDQLAYMYTMLALEVSKNPALNVALLEQFPDIASHTEITVHNVGQLFAVAQQVLRATTKEMLLDEQQITLVKDGELSELASERTTLVGKFDDLIDEVRKSPKGEYDERSELIEALIQGQFTWRMSLKAIRGVAPEDILNDIKEEEGKGTIERNAVLDAVAIQYAAHGDFASAQHLVAYMLPDATEETPHTAESAYVKLWSLATDFTDFQMLHPFGQMTITPINPIFFQDFLSAAALAGEDVYLMNNAAVDLARSLQRGGSSTEDILHRQHQWKLIERFLGRVQEIVGEDDKQAGERAVLDVSRNILDVFLQPGTLVDVKELWSVADILAKYGDARDWNNVRELIDSQPISDIEKIKLYALFAFVLR